MPKAQPSRCSSPSAAYWTGRYGREVTEEEAREIGRNLTQFVQILSRWLAASSRRPPART